MLATAEIYKGITYVRISSLPSEQKELIRKTIQRNQIINILKDETILSDCIQYHHYENWFKTKFGSDEKVKQLKLDSLAIAS